MQGLALEMLKKSRKPDFGLKMTSGSTSSANEIRIYFFVIFVKEIT